MATTSASRCSRQDARLATAHLSTPDRPMMAAVVVRADATGKNFWWVDGGSVGPPNSIMLPFFNGLASRLEVRRCCRIRGPAGSACGIECSTGCEDTACGCSSTGARDRQRRELAAVERPRRPGDERPGLCEVAHLEVRDPSGTVLWKGWPAPVVRAAGRLGRDSACRRDAADRARAAAELRVARPIARRERGEDHHRDGRRSGRTAGDSDADGDAEATPADRLSRESG